MGQMADDGWLPRVDDRHHPIPWRPSRMSSNSLRPRCSRRLLAIPAVALALMPALMTADAAAEAAPRAVSANISNICDCDSHPR